MTVNDKSSGIAEHMKIRQYVINLIYHAGDDVKQLPTARELAKRFGVSHPTVLRAIQDLLDDGFLVKQGRGQIMTKPVCRFKGESLQIFGIGIGDGREVLQSKIGQMLTCTLSLTLLNRQYDYRLQPLTIPRSSTPALADLVRQYTLSGLLWVIPYANVELELQKIKASGLPVAIMGERCAGVSCISWNPEKEYYQVMRRLLAEGRKKPVIINIFPAEAVKQQVVAGIRRACEEVGFPSQECIMLCGDENQEMVQRLSDVLSYGLKPDAVVFTGQIHPFLPLLNQSLDTQKACRLVGREFDIFGNMNFTGLIIRQQIQAATDRLLDNLMLQCQSPAEAPVLDEDIETVLEEIIKT